VIHASPSSRRRLTEGEAPRRSLTAPLTVIGLDKTRVSGFYSFEQGLSVPVHFVVATHFGDSSGESTTSSMSSLKGGNSGNNRSDLDKGNIHKLTFATLQEEGRQAFEAYIADLREPFLSRCKVTRQGIVLRDTAPMVFHKPEVIPEVRPDPSPSHNDIKFMINFALERQAKSTLELLHRLIEEWDRKNLMLLMLILLLLLALLVLLKPIHIKVVHQRVTLQCLTPLPSR
jgi:hypothetical protein